MSNIQFFDEISDWFIKTYGDTVVVMNQTWTSEMTAVAALHLQLANRVNDNFEIELRIQRKNLKELRNKDLFLLLDLFIALSDCNTEGPYSLIVENLIKELHFRGSDRLMESIYQMPTFHLKCYLLDKYFQRERTFYGQISQLLKKYQKKKEEIILNTLLLSLVPKVYKKNLSKVHRARRKRGYDDKGSLRPKHDLHEPGFDEKLDRPKVLQKVEIDETVLFIQKFVE